MAGIMDELAVSGSSYIGVIPVAEARSAGCSESEISSPPGSAGNMNCAEKMAARRRMAAAKTVGTVALVVGAGVLAYFMFGRN